MANELSHSKLLGQMAGESGDYYIALVAVTDKKFSHIVIGQTGATITVCTIRGVDVMTARNYDDLPAGYVMCAGGDDYFDAITLTAGDAEGVIYDEAILPVAASVAVANGAETDPMIPEITFTNAGCSGSAPVRWRTKNATGDVVQSGTTIVYFLSDTGIIVDIPGLVYFAEDDDYTFEINLTETDTWIVSPTFDISA